MNWLSLTLVLTASSPAQLPEQLPPPAPSIVRTPDVTNLPQPPQEQLPNPKEQLQNPKDQLHDPKAPAGQPKTPPPPPPHPISPYSPIDYEHPIPPALTPLPTAPPPLVLQPYRSPERTGPWLAKNAGEPRWSHWERTKGIMRTRFDPVQSAGYVAPGTIR